MVLSQPNIQLAIDVMGGDAGLSSTIIGAHLAMKRMSGFKLLLVGDKDKIKNSLPLSIDKSRIRIIHATESVDMHEHPRKALRFKKDSSMRVAIKLVKSGEAHACVSAGNTGALMATARFVLKTIPGIHRPAIIGSLPRSNGSVYVLDLGANVDSPAEILYQFSVMGDSMVRALKNGKRPSIGLLNVGSEDIKGNNVVQQTAEYLKASELNYVGFVEGDDIFNGSIDVIVTDGFAGNVALKTSEGLAQMLRSVLREEFGKNILNKIAAIISTPVLRSFRNRIDHRRYNGAILLGLKGTVIKSHGGADSLAFSYAIETAFSAAQNNVVGSITADTASFDLPVVNQD